jgi:hypothetical protein
MQRVKVGRVKRMEHGDCELKVLMSDDAFAAVETIAADCRKTPEQVISDSLESLVSRSHEEAVEAARGFLRG